MIEILLGERLVNLASQKLHIIGRGENCDIQISDRTISRRHCAIYINNEEIASILDGDLIANKPSTNGIRINGIPLRFEYGEILKDGDLVELSPTVSFRFFSRKITDREDDQSTLL